MDTRHPTHESPGPLRPGDVLLFHGHGYVSWAIRRFDESDVDHAAIVLDPETMAEATASGLRHDGIRQAVDGSRFAYALRLTGATDATGAVGAARAAVASRTPDTHERLVQLAVLAMTRRLPIDDPSLRRLLCVLMDRAADVVARLADRGRRLTTDAEFVHRCFASTGDPALAIAVLAPSAHKLSVERTPIVGAEAALWEWAAQHEDTPSVAPRWPKVELEPLIAAFARVDDPNDPIVSRCSTSEDQMATIVGDVADAQLLAAATRFRDRFIHLVQPSPPDALSHPWERFHASAAFVTPGDLRYSPSLATATSLRPAPSMATNGPSVSSGNGP